MAKRLNEVRESYNNVALHTTLVASQLSTIRAALEALYDWRSSDRDSTVPSRQLDKDLGMSLSCCAILISVIDGKLDDYSGYMPGLKDKMRYLWLEGILKDYVSNLEGQIRALQLLLTIFQCRTATERRQKLANEESRTIIEQVRAETASLALDNQAFQDKASVLSLDPSVSLDIDSILLKSPAYKRVYGDARLRRPSSASASPIEHVEKAADPAPTSASKEILQVPPPPSRPAPKPMLQSRDRINVWDYYPDEQAEDKTANEMIKTGSHAVFELSGETQGSIAASQQKKESEEELISSLQSEETANKRVNGKIKVDGVDFSVDSVQEDSPGFLQTEKAVVRAHLATIDDIGPVSALVNQLNLAFADVKSSQDEGHDFGLLYGTAISLRTQESHSIAGPRDEASQAISLKDSKEPGYYTKSQVEELGRYNGRRNSSRDEAQRPLSTHSSLYECSIMPVSKEQSTRTSSPFSCDSCRNIGVTDQQPQNDKIEADANNLVLLNPLPDSGNALQHSALNKDLDLEIPDQSQRSPESTEFDTSNESPSRSPGYVSRLNPETTLVQQHRNDADLTKCSNPRDDLARSDFEDLSRVETSRSSASFGLPPNKSPATSDHEPEESKDLGISIRSPSALTASIRPSYSQSSPVVVFSAESRNPQDEQSTLSSNTPSTAHDATSTISSSDVFEDSTISSAQRSSSSNTTATSLNTYGAGLGQVQVHSDLQNELAADKVRGDGRSVQDPLQRSIAVLRQKYLAGPSEDSDTPRPGKARSKRMRFQSLAGSAKGVVLGDAAASGSTLSVQKMLEENVNVDARSGSFQTPLMRAAMNGHIECMKVLKQYGADELAVDGMGMTALHLAVASNCLAAVKWLLENYPPPKPDLLRHQSSIMFRATGVVKSVRLQKSLRETSDTEGSKPIHVAVTMDQGGILKTLIEAGVDIESKDNWGRTPLHRAIITKRRDSLDTLLRSGAGIAAVDAKSLSSLHLAAQTGQVDMIETLLANGAKRWGLDDNGKKAIHSAVQGGNPFAIEALVTERTDLDLRTKSGETLLHLACLTKDLEIARYLLKNLVDVNPWATPSPDILQVLSRTRIRGSSLTPLHYACCMQDFEMALLLLDHEALVNAPSPEGATPLMMAVEIEDTNLVNLLLQREAKVNAKIPGSLITALHLAARRGDLETVQQLCRHRADDSARTSSHTYCRSPLEESMKCPDKKKGQAVEQYLRTVITNRINNKLRANARIHQANRLESSQIYYNTPAGQIAPLVNPVSDAPRAGAQHGYRPDQGYIAQQAQAQSEPYYHPDFDVPDEILPPYEPGPSAPARFAHQAPVHREKYA